MERLPNRAPDAGHRRFRPRLWPTVAMVVTVLVTVMLGNWQARRAEYKLALARQYEQALGEAPLDLARAGEPGADLRYRPVRVSGRFVDAQMLLDNRIHAGRVGFDVLTPLRLASSGDAVLVNRGWVPMGADRRSPPAPAIPSGDVTVVGRIDFPPASGARSGEPEGTIWQRVDIVAMSRATGLRLLPLVVEQIEPVSADDTLARARPAPDFRIATHRGYRVQWYSLAALAIVLWLVLNWQRERVADRGTDGSR